MQAHLVPRKYVDLVRQTTARWTSYYAESILKPGDYGNVNVKTGRLDVSGNIYDDAFAEILAKHVPDLNLKEHPVRVAEPESDFVLQTVNTKRSELKSESAPGVEGIEDAMFKGEWTFPPNRRSALFVMHHPRLHYLPPGEILVHLYKVPELDGKSLVNSVFMCPAYSMYISDQSGEKLSLALIGSRPLPVPGEPGPDIPLEWWTNIDTPLLHKHGVSAEREYIFSPMFTLKRKLPPVRRLFRDSPLPPPEADDFWIDVHPPWEPLDSDGVEDPVVDEDQGRSLTSPDFSDEDF